MTPTVQIILLFIAAAAVVLFGIHLYAKTHPGTAVAHVEQGIQSWPGHALAQAETAMHPLYSSVVQAAERDAQTVTATLKRAEPVVKSQLEKLLLAAEERLTDMSAEDKSIADAQTAIAQANADKAAKLAALDAHVAKLQTYRSQVAAS